MNNDTYICEDYFKTHLFDEKKIKEVYNICQHLQQTSSITEKQNILEQNKNNHFFIKVLYFLLNNQIVTGLDTKKINKNVQIVYYENESGDYCLCDLLDYITIHNTGADNDIAYCQFYISHITQDETLQSFIKSIITKTLKIGVNVKTVNKVYGNNFIPVLNIMLGTSIEKCKIQQGSWFSISQKLNGSRCFYYKGQLYTRQGKVYTGLDHILKDIVVLLCTLDNNHNQSFVLDGELVLKDDTLSDSDRFQKGVGIANSDKDKKEELKLVIFDIIPENEFENHIQTSNYSYRKHFLTGDVKRTIRKYLLQNIEIVKMFYEGTDQNEIWKWLDYAENNDMEGIMVNLDKPYQYKRTKDLIKVKKFFDIDLKCIGIEVGSGKYANTLGAIVCNYKGNKLKVGSGFSDEQRNYYWNNPNEIIGKTVTIKYKEETKNKNGGESLQFPVWVTTRFDK